MSVEGKRVGVIGLGYVGLPLAVQAAAKGAIVTGFDVNESYVKSINARKSPFQNDTRFNTAFAAVSKNHFKATAVFDKLKDQDYVIICVPTPTEHGVPDLSFVISATNHVAKHLRKGQVVVLESTVNPKVTRKVMLERLEKTGLTVGEDYFLAHCPERINPGDEKWHVGNLNRVVGGITAACTKRVADFYRSVINAEIVQLDTVEEAELVKSYENSYRNITIAAINQLALICDSMNISVANILRGMQSKVDQFGLQLPKPGMGVGGHCIPEDIRYVIESAFLSGISAPILEIAADFNDKMPLYPLKLLSNLATERGEHLEDIKLGILGLSYKEDIGDFRRSPSITLARYAVHEVKRLYVHDPHIAHAKPERIVGTKIVDDMHALLAEVDAICVATRHQEYLDLLAPDVLAKYNIKYVIDGRNCLDGALIKSAGVAYAGIGMQ